MNELIKVTKNQNGEPSVSGRLLHEFLEVKTAYKDWFPRMTEYGFTEDLDFCSILSESTGGRPATDHALKLSMAKEISMLQRTAKGKQARLYFIEVESRYMQALIPKTLPDALRRLADEVEENERLKEENEILEIALDESLRYCTVRKYNETYNKQWGLSKCKKIGKLMSAFCRSRKIEIRKAEDQLFGKVNSYPISAWEDFMRGIA